MMNGARLQDLIYRGLGVAGRVAGEPTDAYRAQSAFNPLQVGNRFLKMPAIFVPPGPRLLSSGQGFWEGILDAAYTNVGDYLSQRTGTWFVAAQSAVSPLYCVRTNRVVDLLRPAEPRDAGINAYAGFVLSDLVSVMTGWPASVLSATGTGLPTAGLPAGVRTGEWEVLLPLFTGVLISTGDVIRDDLARTGIVAESELRATGWRLTIREAVI